MGKNKNYELKEFEDGYVEKVYFCEEDIEEKRDIKEQNKLRRKFYKFK